MMRELVLIGSVVFLHALVHPSTLVFALLPGLGLALGLASLQGQMEHRGREARGVSYYGRVYNQLWFNDGYHAEHHSHPRKHWTLLRPATEAMPSSFEPPLLRWIEGGRGSLLGGLERIALASPAIQGWLVRSHREAFARLLTPAVPQSIVIVGGGLFPRTYLALVELFPEAKFRVFDRSEENIARAQAHLRERGISPPGFEHRSFAEGDAEGADLVVFPLAFVGDPHLLQRAASRAKAVAVHSWVWGPASKSTLISPLLLKRLRLEDPRC